MYKGKYFLNVLLVLWQLPQIIIGLIMLAIFHNKTTYTNPNNGITVWNINCNHAFGDACFSTGPIIITCRKDVDEDTLKHETGHSVSSTRTGLFYHIVISIPSICLYWYKKIKKKDQDFYYSHFPENLAEKHGMTNRYKTKMGIK